MMKKSKIILFVASLILGVTSFTNLGQRASAEESKTGYDIGNGVTISENLTKEELTLELSSNSSITKTNYIKSQE